MSIQQYCAVSGTLFALVALAHLLRLILALPVEVDGIIVPQQVSWVGTVVPGVLAYHAFRLARRAGSG